MPYADLAINSGYGRPVARAEQIWEWSMALVPGARDPTWNAAGYWFWERHYTRLDRRGFALRCGDLP